MILGKIYLQKYTWLDTTEVEERNYYSEETAIISPKIEITELLIAGSLSDIQLTKEAINTNDSKLYLESGNVKFSLLDATTNSISPLTISEYLGIYEYNNLIKFIVTIEDNHNNELFKGMLYRNGLDYNERKNNILDILVVSLEQEYKNYYQNKFLFDIGFNTLLNINHTGFKAKLLSSLLNELFPTIEIVMSDSILNYYVARNPYLYKPNTRFYHDMVNIRSGYESFNRDKISRMTYLNSLCVSMGWVWYIYNEKLYIKNRHELDFTERVINWNTEVMNHSVMNVTPDISFDFITIEDGRFFSNGVLLSVATAYATLQSLQGVRKKLFKQNIGYDNNTQPFNNMTLDGNTYQLNYANYTNIYLDSENNKHTFRRYNIYQPSPNVTSEVNEYSQNRTLQLSPYVCSQENGAGLDISLARTTGGYIDIGNGNFFVTNIPQGNNDFRYTGNAGQALFLYDAGLDRYITYDDYTNLRYYNTFADNFQRFSSYNEQILFEVEINGLITNPLQTFKFSGYPYYNLSNINFSLQSLSYNLNKRTSKLILQKDIG